MDSVKRMSDWQAITAASIGSLAAIISALVAWLTAHNAARRDELTALRELFDQMSKSFAELRAENEQLRSQLYTAQDKIAALERYSRMLIELLNQHNIEVPNFDVLSKK